MKKLIIWITIFLICLGLNGCNRSSTTVDSQPLVEIGIESLKAHLDENFIINECGRITHLKFGIPTRQWVTGKLVPAWADFKTRNNLVYREDTTSCENFAFQLHFCSQSLEQINVAVGVFFYTPDNRAGTNRGHAVNVIFLNEEDRVKMVFFEPQTSQFVNLTSSEIASCSFWYF